MTRKWISIFSLILVFSSLFAFPLFTFAQGPTVDTAGFTGEAAFEAPDVPPLDAMNSDGSLRPGYYESSTFMAGSVAVGVVFVESDGSIDPSTEDWTPEYKASALKQVKEGVEWWAQFKPGARVSFIYEINTLTTGVEPISRNYPDQQYWIGDAMGALGYGAPSYFTRVRDYNQDMRSRLGTDWAFTVFVINSNADPDNRFADGYFAYAYLGGPFIVVTSGNDGYGESNMNAVVAHEMGHVFYALDQYYGAMQDCFRKSGYLAIENQNSQYHANPAVLCSSNVNSIMRGQIWPYTANALDPYAEGQVGLRDDDGDTISDVVDLEVITTTQVVTLAEGSIEVNVDLAINPYPSPRMRAVLINKLEKIEYSTAPKQWTNWGCADAACNDYAESFSFSGAFNPETQEFFAIRTTDNFGNVRIINLVGSYYEPLIPLFLPLIVK